jgi:DNA-binding NarL/FixJ family response regulator
MTLRILLADDHALFRRGLVNLISGTSGMQIVGEAEDGRDALEQALAKKPDIVLMDLFMPGLNGWEATRQLLAEEVNTRVIGLSASGDTRSVGRMLEVGASGYLLKDAAVEDLIEGIQTVAKGEVYLGHGLTAPIIHQYVRGSGQKGNGDEDGNGPGKDGSLALSNREREVLQLVAEGHSLKAIASELHVSVKTVETHRAAVMRKLGLPSVAELTKYAIREGITELDA